MKKNVIRLTAVLLLSGLLASCAEEEINPSDQLNTSTKNGVAKDDKGF